MIRISTNNPVLVIRTTIPRNFIDNFLSYPADMQTHRQTDKRKKNRNSSAEIINKSYKTDKTFTYILNDSGRVVCVWSADVINSGEDGESAE